MPRLIDANALLKRLRISYLYHKVNPYIVNAPTVDAVEVVRCKKCRFSKYFEESGTRKCRTQNGMYRTVEDSDFCSYGEREDNETL